MEYLREKREIILKNKVLNELDKFALDFVNVIQHYTDYVIISGYVSILLGRSRATEDIDIFIEKINFEKFSNMYESLEKKGFWCLNSDNKFTLFQYLQDGLAIRFSKKGIPIPNFEVKFPKDELDDSVFSDFITVNLSKGKIKISSLERHIAFKEYYLGADKDKEDAKHIEEIFKSQIDYDKINKLKELIKERNKKWKKRNKEVL